MSHTVTELQTPRSIPRRSIGQFTSLILLWVLAITSTAAAIFVVVNNVHFARVLSNSMSPEFHRGDILFLEPVSKYKLNVGDVAMLPMANEQSINYVHRIVDVSKAKGVVTVETKGDANPAKDPWKLEIVSPQVPLVVGSLAASSLPFSTSNKALLITLSSFMLLLFLSIIIPTRRDGGRHLPLTNTTNQKGERK